MIAAAVALVACGGGKNKEDYRNALPKNAAVVAGFNPGSIGDKMKAGDFAHSDLARLFDKVLADNGVDEADRGLIMTLLSDPKKSGLSMSHDMFVFLHKGPDAVGVLAKVDDMKKVEAAVEKAGVERITDGPHTIAGRMDDQTAVAMFDSKMLMFYASSKKFDAAAPAIDSLLRQKKTDGLMGVKEVAGVFEAGHDFCAVANYSEIMNMTGMSDSQMADMQGLMPYVDAVKGARYAIAGNFEKGRVNVDAQVFFDSKANEKTYMDMASKLTGKMKGDMLKYIPEGAMLAFAGNIDGAALYEQMSQVPDMEKLFRQAPPVKTVMEAIGGDVVVALTGYENMMPSFTMLVELTKPDVILGYASLVATTGAKTVGENQYSVSVMGMTINFGLKGNMFYATNDAATTAALAGQNIASLDGRYADVFRGYGSFVVDIATAVNILGSSRVVSITPDVLPIIKLFSTLEVSSPELGKTHAVLTTADKNKNSAETIYQALQMGAKVCLEE